MFDHTKLDHKQFMLDWNEKFPLDYWWRTKFNIPFGSNKHRQMSYIDIFYAFLEESMYEEYKVEVALEKKNDDELFVPESQLNKKEEKLFENLDLSAFNIPSATEEPV